MKNTLFPTQDIEDIFLIIDGHALIYRTFFSFPRNIVDKNGRLVNAVYGFTRVLLTTLRNFDPKWIAVAFDSKEETFRKKKCEEYKANRKKMPDELIAQLDDIHKIVDILNIPRFEIPGFEADDIIGTLAKKIATEKRKVIIVSGDKDLFQLVDENIHVWLPGAGSYSKDKEYTRKDVYLKLGVWPEQVVDLKALMGDPSDNIKGVKGIGPKTAVSLLKTFKNIKNLYKELDKIKDLDKKEQLEIIKKNNWPIKPKVLENLLKYKQDAFLSYELAKIDTNLDIDFDLEKCKVSSYDKQKAIEYFKNLGFNSLIKYLPMDKFEEDVVQSLF